MTLVLTVPFLRDLFQFGALDAIDVAICFVAGLVSIAWFEALKWFNGRAQVKSPAMAKQQSIR